MDKSRLAAVVYKRTGFPLEPSDPIFALIELNRVALEQLLDEAAARLAERLEPFPARIRSSGAAVAAEVASQGVQQIVEMMAESRRTIASETEQAHRRFAEQTVHLSETLTRQVAAVARAAETLSRGGAVHARCLLAAAVVGVVSCTAGFIGGEVAAAHDTVRPPTGR